VEQTVARDLKYTEALIGRRESEGARARSHLLVKSMRRGVEKELAAFEKKDLHSRNGGSGNCF